MGFKSFYEQAGGAQGALEPKRMNDSVVEVFGRHNPPHLGHGMTFKHANDIAQNEGADQRFYTSRSQDPKKNPLPFRQKLGFLKELFPQHQEKWDDDENVRTILGAASKAHNDGYKNFHFVGGGDRRQGMEDLLRKYNGNLYDFDNIYSHSAGERDEDSDDPMMSLSASKLRRMVQSGDQAGFLEQFPGKDKREIAKRLFAALQMYGQKNEDWEVAPRYNQSTIREMYLDGKLYQVGDIVESLSSGLIGRVHRCGTNHLICVTEDGIMFKNFIHDVQYLNN
jgi:hypothetical protein